MRSWAGRLLFGSRLRILATAGLIAVAAVLFAACPLCASKVSGRILADGQPVAGAFYYPMPGGSPQGCTDAEGRYELTLSYLDWPREVEVCAQLPDGRRTEFGEQVVALWPFARRSLDIELGDRRTWAVTR